MNRILSLILACLLIFSFSLVAFAMPDNPNGCIVDELPNGDEMEYNNGTVKINNGTIVYNYGTIEKNYGTILHNEGTVLENYGVIYPVRITTNPQSVSSSYTAEALPLVTEGTAENGSMQYALGTDDTAAPFDGWSDIIPTGVNAGIYYVWYRALSMDNQTTTEPGCVTSIISPAQLTVSEVSVASKTYDGTTVADVYIGILNGLKGNDNLSRLNGVGTFDSKDVGEGIRVSVTFEIYGDCVSNYSAPSGMTLSADIEPKEVTVTADYKSKLLGEEDPELTATVSELVGDDKVNYIVSREEGETVGTYNITAYGDANQGNYHVTFIDGKFTISPLPTYDVTFDAQGHGTIPASQVVEKGGKVTKPDDLTAGGYKFAGWYKEAACKNAWDFDADTVAENVTLFAKWIKLTSNIDVGDTKAVVDKDDVDRILSNYSGTASEVELTVKVSGDNLDATETQLIENANAGKLIEFYDVALLLKEDDGEAVDFGDSNSGLISITYKFDFNGKKNVKTVRTYDGTVQEITEIANAASEVVSYDEENGTITVTGMKCSTYAFVYEEANEETNEENKDETNEETGDETYEEADAENPATGETGVWTLIVTFIFSMSVMAFIIKRHKIEG